MTSTSLLIIGFGVIPIVVGLGLRMMSRPVLILYGYGLFSSFLSVNLHIGMTFYVTRILLVCLGLAILIRSALGAKGGFTSRIDLRFILLFLGTLIVQNIGVILITPNKADGFRQMFIYLSMMMVFLAVLVLGTQVSIVIKAIKYYLVFGVVQGLTGVYQVAGFMLGLPMYQDFLVGIPTGNPRNMMRVWWDGEVGSPRAFGFLSDANHYAGYLVGVILLALALIAWNRRSIFPYIVLFTSSAGLAFSLSRSGIVTLFLVGGPVLLFLLHRGRFRTFFLRPMLKIGMILVVLRVVLSPIIDGVPEIRALDPWRVVSHRLEKFLEGNDDATTHAHINTRMAALEAFADYPFLGIGLSTIRYSEKYNEYFGGSHSHHLDALGHTGLIGAGLEWAFMALVGLYMWRGIKYSPPNSEGRAVLIGLFASFCAVFMGNFLYHYYLNDFVWFLMGCGVAMGRNVMRDARIQMVLDKQAMA